MKLCVETAGSSLENILKVNVYATSVEMFPAVNEVYRRYFPKDPPARIFVNVPAWNGGFDIPATFPAKRQMTEETISMKLTWYGHSAFRIEAGAAKILIDPFLSDNPS